MNTFKAEVNKIIFALTSVGLVLLMLPASLSAGHFRYGTMSWEGRISKRAAAHKAIFPSASP